MDTPQISNTSGKRPALLTFLCILSFIGSGLLAFSNLFVYLNFDLVTHTIQQIDWSVWDLDPAIILSVDKVYFFLTGLLNIISFIGVRYLWRLRKSGFHVYTLSQILLLIVSTIYVYRPSGQFPTFDLLLSSMFILLYLRLINTATNPSDHDK